MYRILYNESTIFDPYGNENEVVTDASMSVEINAAAYLDFTMSRLHPLYDTIAERDGVVTLYWDRKILFQGVVESIDMDIQGNKSISCVSALDYLNDTVVRPYSTIAGEQELTAPSSVDGYFQWLIDQHNDHVLDAGKLFDVGVNQGANLQQNNFIYRSSTNNPTTASEITDQLLDSLGGYLTMRYVDDRRVLDLYSDIHTMNAQIIDFGVNITDFSKTIDTKDQYTALLLKGGSPEFLGGDFEDGSFDYWVSHPNTPIATSTVHGGTYSSFFTEGNGEYINSSFFYAKKGARYKSTVWIKNERSSTIKAYPRYQVYEAGDWVGKIIDGSYDVPNDGEWHEYSFDFMPNLEDYVRIRPRWVFDTVGNDGNKRVYVDDFDFRQVEGDTDVTEDPISVAMVPDGGMHYDANILKTGDVIYDPTAVARYGYKEKVHEDSTITDVDDLLQAGVKELNKLKDPQIGLDIKAVDLALFMDGYDHLNVGDAVRVRSAIHDTDEFLMVTSITLDLQDPGQSEYNIGKAYDSLTGQQSGFLRSLNSGIDSSLDAVASLDQTTKDQAIQLGTVENVANQAKDTANNAQNTANSALSQSSTVKQELTSFKTSVQQTYETKNDALSKQSSLQQSVNNLRTEVSEKYTTKTTFEALNDAATKTYQFHDHNVNSTGWYKLGTWSGTVQMDIAIITIYAGNGQNGRPDQNRELQVYIKDGFQPTESATGAFGVTVDRIRNADAAEVQVRATSSTSCEVWYKGDALYSAGRYTVSIDPNTTWTHSGAYQTSAPTSGTLQTQEYQTYSTKSYVNQTARTVSLGVVEEYKDGQHGSALATQSDITVAKDSITSTVSQTYLSKNDASVQYATKTQVQQTSDSLTVKIGNILNNPTSDNLWPNQWFDDDKPLLGSTGTENPPSGGKSRLLASRDHFNGLVMAPVYPGHRYRITADAKRTAGSVALKAGIWYTKQTSGHAFDSYTNPTSSSSLGNDWNRYTWEFTVPSGKQAGSLYFQLEQDYSGGSTKWLVGNAILQDITAVYNAQSTANTANSNAQNAQSTANTANTNAINANNRVGNLETCMKMTSDGVRVGKISNGNFTGYSALVNSAGSFDILDSSTKTLASFNKDGLRVNSSSDRGMIIGFNPNTNSGYIGSTPRSTSTGEDYVDIGMNMDFSSGGNLDIVDRLGRINLIGNGIQLITTGDDRVGINFMDVRGAGVVLFDKDDIHNYSSIEIPIGHNFSEFNYIMCFFKTNDGQYFGGTAYHPNGKEYCFTTMGGGAGTTDMSYLKGTRWAFNGTRATRKTTFQIGPGYSTAVNDAVLHIVAIVGFDYYKTSG